MYKTKEYEPTKRKEFLLSQQFEIPISSNPSLEKIRSKSFANDMEYYHDKKTNQIYTWNKEKHEWYSNH